MQAIIAIVAFFGAAAVIGAVLKSAGTALFAAIVVALLAAALVLQATVDSPWFGYAALGLATLAAVSRAALEAAIWIDDRRDDRR